MISRFYLTMGKSCNLRCVYCHQGQEKPSFEYKNTLLDIDHNRVAGFMPTDGDYSVVFYGGEPLLYYESVMKIGELIKTRNPNARLSMITNGTLLTLDRAKKINDINMSVTVSHDGYNFEKTRRTVDFLKINPEPYLNLDFRSISAVASRVNYDFYDIWNYFDEFKLNHGLEKKEELNIQVVKDVSGNTSDNLLIRNMPEFEHMLDNVFGNLEKNILVNNFDTWEWMQYKRVISTIDYRIKNPSDIGVWCGADTKSCHIDLDGFQYPCHNVIKPNSHIDKDGIRPGNYNPHKYDEKCLKCPVYIYCGGGCPVAAPQNRDAMCYTVYEQVIRLLNMFERLRRVNYGNSNCV